MKKGYKQIVKSEKQQKEMNQAIYDLAQLITTATKPIYKSSMFWTALTFLAATIGVMIVDGVGPKEIAGSVFSAVVIMLRYKTTQGIR